MEFHHQIETDGVMTSVLFSRIKKAQKKKKEIPKEVIKITYYAFVGDWESIEEGTLRNICLVHMKKKKKNTMKYLIAEGDGTNNGRCMQIEKLYSVIKEETMT